MKGLSAANWWVLVSKDSGTRQSCPEAASWHAGHQKLLLGAALLDFSKPPFGLGAAVFLE